MIGPLLNAIGKAVSSGHKAVKVSRHAAKATHKTAARTGSMVVGKGAVKPYARTSGTVRYWTKSGGN